MQRSREAGEAPHSQWLAPAVSLASVPLAVEIGLSQRSLWERVFAEGLSGTLVLNTALIPLLLPALVGPAIVALALVTMGGLRLRMPFRLDSLNPVQGFTRVFSKQSLVGGLLALAGLLGMAALMFFLLGADRTAATLLPAIKLPATFWPSLWATAGIGLALAVGAYGLARSGFDTQLKMTPEEFKEDMKAAQGDPVVRRRWMQLRRQISQQRLQAALARADVVVVNPTHYAVAIAYEPWLHDAPTVVAKGRGERAMRIREIAEAQGLPVFAAPPLARDLYRSVPVGGPVPRRLFQAVASLLRYLSERYGYQIRQGSLE